MSRIVENFEGWKKINEATLTWTTDVNSKKIALIFKREFLPTIPKIGKDWQSKTYNEYVKLITSLTSEDLKGVIDFFTKKGYKQPNAQIKKLQEDLMGFMDIKTFQNKEDQTKPFNDGVFGIATAKALISLDAKTIKKYFIDRKRGDYVMKGNVTKKDPNAKMLVAPKMKSDSTNVRTGVEQQHIK